MLTAEELRAARERIEPLIEAAEPTMDRLLQAVGGIGCCVLLTDRNGVPVDRRGMCADDDLFRSLGLWTGAIWSEEGEGTNGIGTCLAEQRVVTVHRDQHFYSRNADLSCTAVPLYDHEGRLSAALDVSSCRKDLTESLTSLIAAIAAEAARRIEQQNFRRTFPNARIVLADDRAAGALLALDGDDLVIGATRAARLALRINPERLRQRPPAADLLGADLSPTGSGDLICAERSAVQRALARSRGNVSLAADALGISRATLHRKLHRLGLRGAN
jgi:transcriptional regulator of acetoin/glycerol metabolism